MYRLRLTLLPILAIAAFLAVLDGGSLPRADGASVANSPASAGTGLFGDADCSGAVTPIDFLAILRQGGGVANAPCANVVDVQCDGDIDAIDSLQVLRFDSGLPVTQQPGCPGIGTSSSDPEPNPLVIGVNLDDGRSVTATIGTEGGEIVGTDANGTTFALSVPQGALLDNEEITLTPVASIDGLPLSGGLTGAVLIAPEDLVLTAPATLTIQTAVTPASVIEQTAFGFDNGEFFLTPVFSEFAQDAFPASGIVIHVPAHETGGIGIGQGTTPDILSILSHTPTDPLDAFRQKLVDSMRRTPNGPTPESYAEVEAIVREFYQWNLRLVLGQAAGDCDLTRKLVRRFVWWVTPVQIGMTSYDFAGERAIVEHGLAVGLASCFEEAYQRCIRGGDRRVEVAKMSKAWGITQAGFAPEDIFLGLVGDAYAKTVECFPCLFGATALAIQPGGRPVDESLSAIDELPCGWQGTISTSLTEDWESNHKSLTMSGQLIWKRRTPDNSIGEICESQSPPCVVYHASGTVEWHYTYSETIGDYHCEDDQSGAFDVALPDRLEDWWQNSLIVRPTDSGITYKGEGNYYEGGTPAGISSACEGHIAFDAWLETNYDTASADRQTIQGAIIIPLVDPPGKSESHWDFRATSCNPTPEPVCQ